MNRPTCDKDFEIITKECAAIKWNKEFELYGRSGQKQHGVDVLSKKGDILIQCKHSDKDDKDTVERIIKEFERDFEKAVEHFSEISTFSQFILATSVRRNTSIQDAVKKKNSEWNSKNCGSRDDNVIDYLFWEDICEIIENNKIHTDNEKYVENFNETLFLHKHELGSKVKLANLFVMQNYEERIINNEYMDQRMELPLRLANFMNEDRTHMLILEGNAGSGKSSFVGWLNYHYSLGDDISKQIFGDRPLLTVRLRDLNRNTISDTGGLIPAILEYINIRDTDKLMARFPNAVMILDGFDELCMIERIEDYDQLIYNLASKSPKGYKLIVTSRPNYISKNISVYHDRLMIKHFDSKQRGEWLLRYTAPEYCGQALDSSIKEYIESVDDDSESVICDTPFTLYMLAASNTSIEMTKNCWQLYHHIFYEAVSETEYNSDGHPFSRYRDIVYRITEEISYRMFRFGNNKFYLTTDEIDEILEELKKENKSYNDLTLRQLTEQCFALCCYWKSNLDSGAVEFYHNNIRDFFLCEKIYREINTIYNERISDDDKIDKLAHLFKDNYMFNIFESAVRKFIENRAIYDVTNLNMKSFPMLEKKNHLLPSLYESMLVNGKLYDNLGVDNHIRTIDLILRNTAYVYWVIYPSILDLDNNERIKWWNNYGKVHESGMINYIFSNIIGAIGYRGDFPGIDLPLANLPLANLSEANLIGANLSGANLSGAKLIGAKLIGADLSGAKLIGAKLSEAKLSEAKLIGAKLIGAKLIGADLLGADLHEADLLGADLHEADLLGADLREADLRGARLPDGFRSYVQEEQVEHLKKLFPDIII